MGPEISYPQNYQCICVFIWGWTYGFGWGKIHFLGRLMGWALKSRLFWSQMAFAALISISGPKKVSISGPTPLNGSRYGFPPIHIYTSSPI
jgi:hypothetical protein